MLSAVISSAYSYPAMRLASQPVHQGCVHSGPLVLGAAPVKSPTPTADRDQTVSRRFEPSSRTTLNDRRPAEGAANESQERLDGAARGHPGAGAAPRPVHRDDPERGARPPHA